MSDNSRLKVVLCWHMHQPQYRDHATGQYRLPWTYLHAIKDYTDMAAHLEAEPQARAVVNFAPTLLEQIDDYATQMRGYLEQGSAVHDPLLWALISPVLPSDAEQRVALIRSCLRANEKRLINRFPAFQRLAEMARWLLEHMVDAAYVSDQFLVDLLVWYHLAWLGESVRRGSSLAQALQEKQQNYTLHDRRLLLQLMSESISGLIGRYRRLSDAGQVELSVTPYAHPIVPLMLDIRSAREAMPDVQLPLLEQYPGGKERVQWHIEHGLEVFKRHFGRLPGGCWPSEGGISEATLVQLQQGGFRWVASGESVLRNSLARQADANGHECLHRPYRHRDSDVACFFRDDGLSDTVGFRYAEWHADDAVANLVHNLSGIGRVCANEPGRVVSIIMDGENAWEYFPENGWYFLSALYRQLSQHPELELTTFSAILDQGIKPAVLDHVVAGSWVYGTFSTWIGNPDKNRAWDMLGEAKRAFDHVMASGVLTPEQRSVAERQLAICEGSDWFWWFGDYNPGDTVRDFDHLYRTQLTGLYLCLGVEPPEYLAHVFAHGGGAPEMGGVMRPGGAHGS